MQLINLYIKYYTDVEDYGERTVNIFRKSARKHKKIILLQWNNFKKYLKSFATAELHYRHNDILHHGFKVLRYVLHYMRFLEIIQLFAQQMILKISQLMNVYGKVKQLTMAVFA